MWRQEAQVQTASLLRMKDRGTDTANGRCVGAGWLVSIKRKCSQVRSGGSWGPTRCHGMNIIRISGIEK